MQSASVILSLSVTGECTVLIIQCWLKSSLRGIANSHLFSYQNPGQEGDPSSCLLYIRTGTGKALVCDKT